ncbi:hypothetical protein QFC21_007248 [Naganishia friedmannii]|uniref:Uncharacterized protein n=1 Tax=Naganishia friedmannii TaxID=89922 RepID=A0ACC2UWX6_9TREE|nr:hypothetical protein QFC21_007248 [Naganishia friedmannii]
MRDGRGAVDTHMYGQPEGRTSTLGTGREYVDRAEAWTAQHNHDQIVNCWVPVTTSSSARARTEYQPYPMDHHRLRGGGGEAVVVPIGSEVARQPSRSESSSTETSSVGLHRGGVGGVPGVGGQAEREEQDRESVSTTSSFDVAQYHTYLRNAQVTAQPPPQQPQQYAQGHAQQQQYHQRSAEGHGSSSRGTTTSSTSEDLHAILPDGAYVGAQHQQAVPQAASYPYLPSAAQYTHPLQHVPESHSRGSRHPLPLHHAHPHQQQPQQQQRQQPRREYSVSDSLTSSGTSHNEYTPLPGADDTDVYVGRKGKGRAMSGEVDGGGKSIRLVDAEFELELISATAVVLGPELGASASHDQNNISSRPYTATSTTNNGNRHHRRTTSSASRKTDDSASYPAEFTAQLLTGLSKRPAPQKTTTLTVSGKKQNLPPSAYPHLRPGDTVTDPNTPHIHGCPYCNKVYRGQHARSICRRHQMSKHGIELEVQVKKSRWDNNPNRPATEQEKHQRTLESKRRWAAKDRKRRRCVKLGIPYIDSSDEDASGSDDNEQEPSDDDEENGVLHDDNDVAEGSGTAGNAIAGPSSARRPQHLVAGNKEKNGTARAARSRSRASETPASQTPELAVVDPARPSTTAAGTKGARKPAPMRRGSSNLQQVAFPEAEDGAPPAASSRKAGKSRAEVGRETASSGKNGTKNDAPNQALPFSTTPLGALATIQVENTYEQPKRRRTSSSKKTSSVRSSHIDLPRQELPLPRYISSATTSTMLVNGSNGPLAMVPTQTRPTQAIVYQQPMSDAPVFMNIPEGARVYAVQYRDDPRTGYRVVSAPQPVQFFMPPTTQMNLPLRPNSAPPEDAMGRVMPMMIPGADTLSPVIVHSSEVHTIGLAPAVTLRPEPMRRVTSLQPFPTPVDASDVDVFSSRLPMTSSSSSQSRGDDSGTDLMRAAIRRSSADAPATQHSSGKKPAGSQDSDSNEEAAEILLAFSNSPARSVTASSKKHSRHQSMDTGLSARAQDAANGQEMMIGLGSSRLQDITTGLQTTSATSTPKDVEMEPAPPTTDADDDTTPLASRTRPADPPPLRPTDEEMLFQRANLWPARSASPAMPKPANDDPFRVPEATTKPPEVDGSSTPGELAPSAYIMAPPPRPPRIPALAFRQPKDVIPSSSTNPGLSSPPTLEPSSSILSSGPTPKHPSLRHGPAAQVGGSRIAFATPARRDWVASSPALGHPFSSPSGLDLTHKLGLAADVSTVPDSPSWLELVRATPDAKSKRNRTESSDGEVGVEGTDETPGKRLRL